jgi:hypothetical protein
MKKFKEFVSEKIKRDSEEVPNCVPVKEGINDLHKMWNSGASDEEMIKIHGKDAVNKLKAKYKEGAIPVSDLYGFKQSYDDRQKLHYGITGLGARLKAIIKSQK